MIFHVARAFDLVGMSRAALELVEDRPVGLRHHVGEHVEAAAMRHADDDLLQPELAAALDHLLERRHHRLAAVEPEALGAGVFHVEEALEDLGLDQLLEDRLLALRREANGILGEPRCGPGSRPLLGIGDMHVLDADMLAVGCASGCRALGGACRTQGRARRRDRSGGRSRPW